MYWLIRDEAGNPKELVPGDLDAPQGITELIEEDAVEVDYIKALHTETLRIPAIKEEAKLRIIKQIPGAGIDNFLMKENNLQARVTFLLRKEILGTISAEETTELDNAEALWLVIEDIRNMSDAAEINGDSLETLQAAYDAKGYGL